MTTLHTNEPLVNPDVNNNEDRPQRKKETMVDGKTRAAALEVNAWLSPGQGLKLHTAWWRVPIKFNDKPERPGIEFR